MDDSSAEQQMALPAESQTFNIAMNVMHFKKITRGIKFVIFGIYLVANVKNKILLEKNS